MEKVAAKVYLLTPSNVEVSAEERRACRSAACTTRDGRAPPVLVPHRSSPRPDPLGRPSRARRDVVVHDRR